MKVKTITCHDVYNHGASLQAYALQQYLLSFGHEVEIIDYKPPYLSNHYKLWSISSPFWSKNSILKAIYLVLKLPRRLISLKRKKAFDDFTRQYLKLTKERYTSNEELKENCPVADVFIAGSDQIWNCLFPNGKDPAFYLNFVSVDKIKASYAASFAGSELDARYHEMVRGRVNALNYISVREKSGLKILENIGVNGGIQVADPVFLMCNEFWLQFAKEKFSENYLFVYDFEGSEQIRDISLKIARKHNLKIYSVNCRSSYIDRKFLNSGPRTFVSLIKDAKYIVSNSFHGTAFALIFEKEFVVVERSEGINARMKDLLQRVGLSERILTRYRDFTPIDFNTVKQKLNEYTDSSKTYINNVLENN